MNIKAAKCKLKDVILTICDNYEKKDKKGLPRFDPGMCDL